jgi:hypothetical protein
MKKVLSLILLSIPFLCQAQEFVTDLNGFRIGQFREVPKNHFVKAFQSEKFEDGYEYEAFIINRDSTVYMIFEYAPSDLYIIWSIQVTGSENGYDCHFKGLKLGMPAKEVIKILGKPESIEDAGEYGKRWEYANTNYSLEINPNGKLSSIKIIDNSDSFFPNIDLGKLPKFAEYSQIFGSGNRNQISELLAPDVEIYKDNSTYSFTYSIETEVKNDNSKLFSLLNEMAQVLKQINPNDSLQYEENVRLVLHQNPMHVAKFRLNNNYSEVVFKWRFGRYLIWEIKIN